jgi:hypothetical protein
MTAKELEELRSSAQRRQPYGNESWKTSIAKRLGLESTLHARGQRQNGTKDEMIQLIHEDYSAFSSPLS